MLKLVYQDCPLCGSYKQWGEATIETAKASGLEIEKISFASAEGSSLCKAAIEAGIQGLPFITNGRVFSDDIHDFIAKEKATKKGRKKNGTIHAQS